MSKILFVTSSPRGAASFSTQVAQALVAKLQAGAPGSTVATRDFAKAPLPHIGEDFVAALALAPEQRSPAQAAAIARSDTAVADLFAADILVIASPMHNFGLPSTLKAWFDHLVRAGATFSYGAAGPEGLVKGKKAYVIEARGGVYADGPMRGLDFQEPYLKTILGFIGITDVEVIAVEGVAFGPEAADKAVSAALGKVAALAA